MNIPTIADRAAEWGCSTATAWRRCKRDGLPTNRRGGAMVAAERKRVARVKRMLLKPHMTLAAIARKCGLTRQRVHQIKKSVEAETAISGL